MDRTTFSRRLGEAVAAARNFGQQFIAETLPEPVRCRVLLSQSMDHELRPGEVVYPTDRSPGAPLDLAEHEVLDLLWRSGDVPEWIDVRVFDVVAGATIVELSVCGRFTSKDGLLYHQQGGRPPFHVTSPPLPPGYQYGERFSLSLLRSRRAPT